jgi:hypothetical protein
MSYARTVAAAIGLAFALWLAWNGALLLYELGRTSSENATGFGFVWGGVLEGILTSLILGFIVGSIWYLLRKPK